MDGGDNRFYRFLTWRPVGSPPIYSPTYCRSYTFRSDAEFGAADYIDCSGLDPATAPAFLRADVRARYDGLYVMDLFFDHNKADDLGAGASEDQRRLFLRNAAFEIAMLIGEQLGHTHSFHSTARVSRRSVPWGRVILPVILAGCAVLAGCTYLHFGLGRPTMALWLFLLSGVLFAIGMAWLMVSKISESHSMLDPNNVLRINPIALNDGDSKVPLNELPFHDSTKVAELQTLPPTTASQDRIAIGQLRRQVLKVHEGVSALIINKKQANRRHTRWLVPLFWFNFALWGFFVGAAMAMNALSPDIPVNSVQLALAGATGFLLLSLLLLIYLIICHDLPAVKLLRATSGFFSSAEPLNDVITQVLGASRPLWELPVISPTFANIIKTVDTQLQGEVQRLQIKQFWVAAIGTSLGALVAAIAITISLPGQAGETVYCEIDFDDPNKRAVQTCDTKPPNLD